MPTTQGMKPGGYYNAHSDAQRAAIDVFLPWLVESVSELPVAKGSESPLVILDIGSSQGANAIHAMHRLVEAVRRHTNAPAWLFFSDLPTNDYNQVFANLFRDGTAAFAEPDVFTGAVAGSAYKPIVPAHTVHIATSFNMVGWYDSLPDDRLPHYIQPNGPKHPSNRASVSDAEREPFRVQSDIDLRKFYQAQAQELVPGGKLLLQVFGRSDLHSTTDGLYDVLSDALLATVDSGDLPAKYYDDLIIPIYCRSARELTSPLQSDPLLAQAFRIDKVDTREVSVPFNVERARTGDIAAWARSYTRFFRAVTETNVKLAMPASVDVEQTAEKIYRAWSACSLLIQRATSFITSRSRRCSRELDALRNILGAIWVNLVTSVIMD